MGNMSLIAATTTDHTARLMALAAMGAGGGGGGTGSGGGDAETTATLNALIDRSITEIRSDVEEVGSYVFYYCSNLTTADFPVATSIGGSAFYGCSKLTVITLRSEKTCSLAHTNTFFNTPIASGTGYVYVPSALVDSYKSATNWSTYANQFRALEDYTVDGTITGELDTNKTGA